jgi:hypothetical protein
LGDNGDFRARFEINKSREATCILEQWRQNTWN